MKILPLGIRSIIRVSNYVSSIDCMLNLAGLGCTILIAFITGRYGGTIALVFGFILLLLKYAKRDEIETYGFDILMLFANKKAKAVVDDLILFNEWKQQSTSLVYQLQNPDEEPNRKLCIKYMCFLTFACRKDTKRFPPLQAEDLLKIGFTDDEINRYIAHKEKRRKEIENYLKENNIPLSEVHKYKQI